MGFLPLPLPRPEAGGGASFNGASCRFGEELKKSPKSSVSFFGLCCTEDIVQSFALSIEFELPLEVLRLLRLWLFEEMGPLFQLHWVEVLLAVDGRGGQFENGSLSSLACVLDGVW